MAKVQETKDLVTGSSRKAKPDKFAPDENAALLTLDEINERYYLQWCLLVDDEWDEDGRLCRARVLYHSPKERELGPVIRRFRKKDRVRILSVFLGGTRYMTGDEFFKVLDEAAARGDYVNAHW